MQPYIGLALETVRNHAKYNVIHENIVHKQGVITGTCPVYRYGERAVSDSSTCAIYWDRQISTNRYIPNNKPDVLLVD